MRRWGRLQLSVHPTWEGSHCSSVRERVSKFNQTPGLRLIALIVKLLVINEEEKTNKTKKQSQVL